MQSSYRVSHCVGVRCQAPGGIGVQDDSLIWVSFDTGCHLGAVAIN